jgi:hypothetical protein
MKIGRALLWVTLFAIAMAFLESAVVIYIRELLYPEGFGFPLVTLQSNLAKTEMFREVATIVMLLAIGYISGDTNLKRFAHFIYAFAIWDIFYYLFLYLLIGWPETLFVWDVLFLIPVTWTGPVISPLIVCFYMIFFSLTILLFSDRGITVSVSLKNWLLLITGSIVLIVAFTWDFSRFIFEHYSVKEIWNLTGSGDDLFNLSTQYVPRRFNWIIFSAGSLLVIIPIISVLLKSANELKGETSS